MWSVSGPHAPAPPTAGLALSSVPLTVRSNINDIDAAGNDDTEAPVLATLQSGSAIRLLDTASGQTLAQVCAHLNRSRLIDHLYRAAV